MTTHIYLSTRRIYSSEICLVVVIVKYTVKMNMLYLINKIVATD